MRVAVLIGKSPRSMYVANALCARLDVACIIRETGRELSWRKLRTFLRPATLRAKAYRKLQRWILPDEGEPWRDLFTNGQPQFDQPGVVFETDHINSDRTLRALTDARPDCVAVFGTSLLKRKELFDLAPGRVFNLHGGISPEYRGADSIFWALYHRDFARIGCTIHRIDTRIDSGDRIACVYPAIEPGLGERRLLVATLAAGAPLYAEALTRVANGAALGVPQPPGGQLFLHKHRGWRHDRELARRYRTGPYPDVVLPSRVEWFTTHDAPIPDPSGSPMEVQSGV